MYLPTTTHCIRPSTGLSTGCAHGSVKAPAIKRRAIYIMYPPQSCRLHAANFHEPRAGLQKSLACTGPCILSLSDDQRIRHVRCGAHLLPHSQISVRSVPAGKYIICSPGPPRPPGGALELSGRLSSASPTKTNGAVPCRLSLPPAGP